MYVVVQRDTQTLGPCVLVLVDGSDGLGRSEMRRSRHLTFGTSGSRGRIVSESSSCLHSVMHIYTLPYVENMIDVWSLLYSGSRYVALIPYDQVQARSLTPPTPPRNIHPIESRFPPRYVLATYAHSLRGVVLVYISRSWNRWLIVCTTQWCIYLIIWCGTEYAPRCVPSVWTGTTVHVVHLVDGQVLRMFHARS